MCPNTQYSHTWAPTYHTTLTQPHHIHAIPMHTLCTHHIHTDTHHTHTHHFTHQTPIPHHTHATDTSHTPAHTTSHIRHTPHQTYRHPTYHIAHTCTHHTTLTPPPHTQKHLFSQQICASPSVPGIAREAGDTVRDSRCRPCPRAPQSGQEAQSNTDESLGEAGEELWKAEQAGGSSFRTEVSGQDSSKKRCLSKGLRMSGRSHGRAALRLSGVGCNKGTEARPGWVRFRE